jgi:hypothetical protein
MKTTYTPDRSTRRATDTTVKEAIDELLRVYRLRGKFDETHVVYAWGQVMGQAIARRTEKVYVQDRKLFLQITSPSLANELLLSKSRIIELLNEEVKAEVIDDVIFL